MLKKLLLLLTFISIVSYGSSNHRVNLSGEWRFALDPRNVGESERWYAKTLPDAINLPGSLQEQGYGEDVSVDTKWTGQIVDSTWFFADKYRKFREKGNVKVPFWLNPSKHYVGVAWYQNNINVTNEQSFKDLVLDLERCHWQTTLYLDGKIVAVENSLATPHRFSLGKISKGKHTLTLRVDNSMVIEVGKNAHSVSDHTQSNWNGVVGGISVNSRPDVYIDRITTFPNVKDKRVVVRLDIVNNTDADAPYALDFKAQCKDQKMLGNQKGIAEKGKSQIEYELDLGDSPLLWDEFSPNVYSLTADLRTSDETMRMETTFGMREIGKNGRRFTVNGRPVFLRGTLECAIFPLTGYPAMDRAYWTKIYSAVKAHGLNHVRFHSWCPPKAAFEVADSMGIYLQVECSAWTNVGSGTNFDKWVYQESDRMLREYGNHPSFFSMLYGNEPSGKNQNQFLSELCTSWREKDGRHQYSSSGGWPYIEAADFFNSPHPRIQAWGDGLKSIINAQRPSTTYDFGAEIKKYQMPTVSHEIGQWCVYPNLKERSKYKGLLKAKNFDIFEQTLAENGMADMAETFLYASGRLQTLCYKADIEAALRTPEFAGFQLLDLHDFPGQGTALVGVLDPFWESKGYVTPQEYSRFCNTTVPLARIENFTVENNSTFKAAIEVAHFGAQPLENAVTVWTIRDKSGKIYKQGEFKSTIPIDNCTKLGSIEYPTTDIHEPKQLTLTVNIANGRGENSWNFWVYPTEEIRVADDVYVTEKLDAQAISRLNSGGKVLLTLRKGDVSDTKGGNIAVGFSSIFWNTAWTRGQAPHTLGVYYDKSHPALKLFPGEGYSDYQWWDMMSSCNAVVLDEFNKSYRPIVGIVDDWFTNRKLGMIFEFKVGDKGKLLICSADLNSEPTTRIAAKNLKKSLINYVNSSDFNPTEVVDPQQIQRLLK